MRHIRFHDIRWEDDFLGAQIQQDLHALHPRGQWFVYHFEEDDPQAVDVHFLIVNRFGGFCRKLGSYVQGSANLTGERS